MSILTVRVLDQQTTVVNARYVYELRSGAAAQDGSLGPEYSVDVSRSLVAEWCGGIDRALTAAADPMPELRRLGQLLYNALFPAAKPDLPQLGAQLFDSRDPVLIRTNDQRVPWELLHDGSDFLGMRRDLGRQWIVQGQPVSGRTIGRIGRALVIGDTLDNLPAARTEAGQVAKWLRARGVDCTVLLGEDATLAHVVEELASSEQPYDLFHFCGHASAASDPPGLTMHRRDLLDEVALGTLARGVPPVVFINGCASAGLVASICRSFMMMGAQAVIGTRTDVVDGSAWHFAEHFYERLLAHDPVGTAIRSARRRLHEQQDSTWASFVLYGAPYARFADGSGRGVNDAGRGAEQAREESVDRRLSPPVLALLTRVAMSCGRRTITSVDLLIGLLQSPDLQQRVKANIGAERQAAVLELLQLYLERAAGPGEDHAATGDDPSELVLSGTVDRIMSEALADALTRGDTSVGTDDLAAAFVQVGGGTSARLLELCGVEPAQLFRTDPPGPGEPAGSGERPAAADEPSPLDELSPEVVNALCVAQLMAVAKGQVVGSHTLLYAFAALDSEALRRALAEQGTDARHAFRRYRSRVRPGRRDLSRRVRAALDRARAEKPGTAGEGAVLRALFTDADSSAREVLHRLHMDPERLIRSLSEED
jgi:hypothetical protein